MCGSCCPTNMYVSTQHNSPTYCTLHLHHHVAHSTSTQHAPSSPPIGTLHIHVAHSTSTWHNPPPYGTLQHRKENNTLNFHMTCSILNLHLHLQDTRIGHTDMSTNNEYKQEQEQEQDTGHSHKHKHNTYTQHTRMSYSTSTYT